MKTIMKSLLTAAAVAVAVTGATAADYPEKNLEFIVPFPPGGASNFIGRAIAKELSADLGREITVLNRAGAAGTVGAAELARAEPDGYTIGILTSTPLVMKPQSTKLPYDLSSFSLICRGFDNPLILTVSAKSDINTLEDLIALAKENPTAVKFYTEGPGTLQDIAMGALQEAGEFKAIGVPMTGHQTAVQNLLSGVITVAPLTADSVIGSPELLKPIAIMSRNRVPNPDVATVNEVLNADVVYSLTGAVVAPAGLEEAKYDRLVAACENAQKAPEFVETLESYSMPPVTETGAGFAEAFKSEYDSVGKYMAENGMTPN